ncbi:M1 family metallopeptidase [Saccharicrinis sp. 156]|uniref:M1 family metallopeptidase n=1 Tax=Saccharicrinis sp. 156 TaxID=3417574 RepID=UPI003D33B855
MSTHKLLLLLFFAYFYFPSYGQNNLFTRQDSLRGSITPEREWWDLTYYHLSVKINPADSSFSGTNKIGYRVNKSKQLMQIDLQPPMKITRVVQEQNELEYGREGNAWFIELKAPQRQNDIQYLDVEFSGKPQVSKKPPWQGGVSWGRDKNGKPLIVTANQGDGASLWWPCKDHPYDEPDSMLISITVPEPLMNVSNGRLRNLEHHNDETNTSHWFVSNPINNYGVNINVGDYVHFSNVYEGEKGDLDCDYWVLPYNLKKAKKQFKQAHLMLEAFEHWFGPYPFYEDGYKLVEVSYPGMEHQSSVTYGNGYKNGYGGRDVSRTGWGDKFDFILVHESGHEWFANSITNWDVADMWIHESFIAYSESLFVDYFWGKEAGATYCRGTRLNIKNDRAIIGQYDVNSQGSGDMYAKGANMLHTIRQIVNDDEKWRQMLRGLNQEFYHQTVRSEQVENYICQKSGLDLKPVFDQYLRDTRIPTFEYALLGDEMRYRWANCIGGFQMKVAAYINGEIHYLTPGTTWQNLKKEQPIKTVEMDKDFYTAVFKILHLDTNK